LRAPRAGLVSVVLPCHDVEAFLPAALTSILAQTWEDLEVVAIDDGSTDGTLGLLEDHARRDGRVRVLANERNLGLVATLNRGVAEATGDYVARMDPDDVCHPDRILGQLALMDRHSEVDIVGTGAWLLDENGRRIGTRPPRCTTPAGARFLGLFATPLVHGSILARGRVLKEHPYHTGEEAVHTEDYELLTRLLAAGYALRNLDAPLYGLRTRRASVSRTHEMLQIENFVRCARRHLERTTDLRPTDGAHRVLVNRMTPATTPAELRTGLGGIDALERAFLEREPEAAEEIRAIAAQQRVDVLGQALLKGGAALRVAALPMLVRYGGSLVAPGGRRHLAAKLGLPGDPDSR
jgi:glycosyltransferase involved in cell wall biosynthesis